MGYYNPMMNYSSNWHRPPPGFYQYRPQWSQRYHYETPPRFMRQQEIDRNEQQARQQVEPERGGDACYGRPPQRFGNRPYVNSLKYIKTKAYAIDPSVKENQAPCLDLCNPNVGIVKCVKPGETIKINTHLIFKFPPNKFGFIVDKPSNAIEKQLKVMSHVVYSGYKGEIVVVLQNFSKKSVEIFPGDVIAHMILVVSCTPLPMKIETAAVETNPDTERVENDKDKDPETDEYFHASLYRLF